MAACAGRRLPPCKPAALAGWAGRQRPVLATALDAPAHSFADAAHVQQL